MTTDHQIQLTGKNRRDYEEAFALTQASFLCPEGMVIIAAGLLEIKEFS